MEFHLDLENAIDGLSLTPSEQDRLFWQLRSLLLQDPIMASLPPTILDLARVIHASEDWDSINKLADYLEDYGMAGGRLWHLLKTRTRWALAVLLEVTL